MLELRVINDRLAVVKMDAILSTINITQAFALNNAGSKQEIYNFTVL